METLRLHIISLLLRLLAAYVVAKPSGDYFTKDDFIFAVGISSFNNGPIRHGYHYKEHTPEIDVKISKSKVNVSLSLGKIFNGCFVANMKTMSIEACCTKFDCAQNAADIFKEILNSSIKNAKELGFITLSVRSAEVYNPLHKNAVLATMLRSIGFTIELTGDKRQGMENHFIATFDLRTDSVNWLIQESYIAQIYEEELTAINAETLNHLKVVKTLT